MVNTGHDIGNDQCSSEQGSSDMAQGGLRPDLHKDEGGDAEPSSDPMCDGIDPLLIYCIVRDLDIKHRNLHR